MIDDGRTVVTSVLTIVIRQDPDYKEDQGNRRGSNEQGGFSPCD